MNDDAEITAMAAVYEALLPLDPDARRRVQAWTSSRFSDEGLTTTLKTVARDLTALVEALAMAQRWCPNCRGTRRTKTPDGEAVCATCSPLWEAVARAHADGPLPTPPKDDQ